MRGRVLAGGTYPQWPERPVFLLNGCAKSEKEVFCFWFPKIYDWSLTINDVTILEASSGSSCIAICNIANLLTNIPNEDSILPLALQKLP